MRAHLTKAPPKPRGPKITEAHVQKAVTDLLALDGWRAIRTDPISDRSRGKGFGEVGMPDYLYIRYSQAYDSKPWSQYASVLWIEFKRPGEKPKPHQEQWHEAERVYGALVLVVDSIDDFIRWYRASGLARKVLQHGTKSKD